MLEEHEKNSLMCMSSLSVLPTSQVVYYAYKPLKLVVYCFYIIIQKTRNFYELTGMINHS